MTGSKLELDPYTLDDADVDIVVEKALATFRAGGMVLVCWLPNF